MAIQTHLSKKSAWMSLKENSFPGETLAILGNQRPSKTILGESKQAVRMIDIPHLTEYEVQRSWMLLGFAL